MEAKAIAKGLRVSPIRARLISDMIRGKSCAEALNILRLLFLMVSLESVLVFENNQKAENISMRVSELIARPESKKKIKAFIKRMYTIRSTIVHSGSDYISQEDLKKLVKYTKLTLSYLIFINYSFNL